MNPWPGRIAAVLFIAGAAWLGARDAGADEEIRALPLSECRYAPEVAR